MRADNRGITNALRRAVREDDRGMADFLTDAIVEHLDRLDAMDDALAERFGITVEQDGDFLAWWVPADPGPIRCDTLTAAIEAHFRLRTPTDSTLSNPAAEEETDG